MVSAPECGIVKCTPDAHNIHTGVLVTQIVFYLLKTRVGEEWRNAVHNGKKSSQGESCRHAHHRLFRNAHIEKPRRVARFKITQEEMAKVSQKHRNALVRAGLKKGLCKLLSHASSGLPIISLTNRSYSSGVGAR